MNQYNVTKEMFGAAIVFVGIFIAPPLFSNGDRKAFTEAIKKEKCLIRINWTNYSGTFKIVGLNPETGEKCICETNNRWWVLYKNEMDTNDLFIKNEGDLYFKIIKEDTVIVHKWK